MRSKLVPIEKLSIAEVLTHTCFEWKREREIHTQNNPFLAQRV